MKKFLFLSFTFLFLTLVSCDKDHDHDNEEELITTLVYTLASPGSEPVVMTFKDLDGEGGNDPIVSTVGNFKVNQTYTGVLSVLNESVTPAENIATEIQNEALEHQFFFEVSGGLAGKFNVTYEDKDSNNNPLGIVTRVTATQAGTGKLKVTLRHEPNKSASGVSGGNISNAGGETDIEVTFDVEAK